MILHDICLLYLFRIYSLPRMLLETQALSHQNNFSLAVIS